MLRRALALAGFLCFVSTDLFAQTCAGLPSFNEGPFQLSLGSSFSEGFQTFGGGIAGGSERLFGGFGVALSNFSDFDSTGTTLGGSVGGSVDVAQGSTFNLCPGASLAYTTGLDVENVDLSVLGFRVGARGGFVASDNGTLALVPTFGLDIARDRVTIDLGPTDEKQSDTYGVAHIGLGFIVNKRIGIIPAVAVPFAIDDSNPEFSITVAFQLGRR